MILFKQQQIANMYLNFCFWDTREFLANCISNIIDQVCKNKFTLKN